MELNVSLPLDFHRLYNHTRLALAVLLTHFADKYTCQDASSQAGCLKKMKVQSVERKMIVIKLSGIPFAFPLAEFKC